MKMQMREITMFHRKTDGSVKVWMCRLRGSIVASSWGKHGGRISTTSERVPATLYATAQERALDLFKKKVRHRKRKGYVDKLDDVVKSVAVQTTARLGFDEPLSRSFAPAKPIKQLNVGTALEWEKDGKLIVQRKRDGMRHFIVTDSKGVPKIYSSGKDDMTEHLQPLLTGLYLPRRSVIDCELVVADEDDNDLFLIVSGICRSKPERAQRMIREAQERGETVKLMAFDLLWLEGHASYASPYKDRYRWLEEVVANTGTKETRLQIMPKMPIKLKGALHEVEVQKWEGLVVWRKDQATVVQVNGTPKRVNCYKMKPVLESDVIATGFIKGKGRNASVVGKLEIACRKTDLKSGAYHLVPMGRCGTGLDDKTREAALRWTYPCVIQIEYDKVTQKGFRFPVFIRKRDDKEVHGHW